MLVGALHEIGCNLRGKRGADKVDTAVLVLLPGVLDEWLDFHKIAEQTEDGESQFFCLWFDVQDDGIGFSFTS